LGAKILSIINNFKINTKQRYKFVEMGRCIILNSPLSILN
jgi:hypothetical protein